MAISLKKGQKISLSKGGEKLRCVEIGLGWGQRVEEYQERVGGFFGFGGTLETRSRKVEVDLDAACLIYDNNKTKVDAVYYGQLKSNDGSVQHSGDDRVGGGSDNETNETIVVYLDRVPTSVQSIVFVVNSYSGETFQGIPSAFCNVVNKENNQEFARYDLGVSGGDDRGFIAAKVYRHGDEWKFHAIGEKASGQQRTVKDIEPFAKGYA